MDNVLRLSFHKDPITLDPAKSCDKLSSAIIFLLYKGLTRLEADHSIHSDLAESFQVLDNHKKFIFHLGEHFWSDGTPITAHDFVHSWRRALSPEFPLRATNLFYHLKNAEKAKNGLVPVSRIGVTARNDRTLVVELEYPCPYFLELTSFCLFFPTSPKMQERQTEPICSGPFRLREWKQGREIILEKNSLCRAFSPVHINGIHIHILPNEKEAFDRFERGELDWIGNPTSPLPVNYLPALVLNKKIKPLSGITCCWFNAISSPFSNAHLRKAFAASIPRDKLLAKLSLSHALSARRFSPSILHGGKCGDLIEESNDRARDFFHKALRELEVHQLRVSLTYEATEEFDRMASLLKTYWEDTFPIRIQLEPLSFKEFWYKLPKQRFQLSLLCSVSQYTDRVSFLEKLEFRDIPINFSGWENAKYKNLLQQYRATLDRNKRDSIAENAERVLLEEMPIAPICYYHFTYLQQPYVKNLAVSPIGVMQFDRVILENRHSSVSEHLISAAY
jgi:oligopeptide transport system substrate-binding protein